MSSIRFLSLLAFIISCEAQAQGAVQPTCITPDNNLGACVNVKYCVTIMTALINNDHLTHSDVAKFLRESQCGITAGSHKVCCNVESIDFGEDPITPTPEIIIQTSTTIRNEQPRPIERGNVFLSDSEKCGRLQRSHEKPLKWIAELWFKTDRLGRILYDSKCIGTVISSKHVIAPAHCVASLPANVSLSHVDVEDHEYTVAKVFIHASYNQPKFANDIAIIELDIDDVNDGNAERGENSTPQINNAICLGMLETNSKSTRGIVKTTSRSLKYAQVEYIENNKCSRFFDQQFTELTAGQFCANIQTNETEFLPFIGAVVLQLDNTRQQYSLKGFTSTTIRTEQAFDESRPYIFTDVEQQFNWIRAAIGDISGSESSPHRDDDGTNENSLRECQMGDGGNSNGRCVNAKHCLQQQSRQRISQCSTSSNQILKDEVCCPERFINQTAAPDIDERFRQRRGVDLLDMNKCGNVNPSRRIVGGKSVDLKEFPWYALMKYKFGRINKFTCGGSLISSRYTLTCAHCITSLPHGYQVVAVRLGEYDLKVDPDCRRGDERNSDDVDCNSPIQDIEIEELIPHSQYNNPRFSNDIGLVRMAQDVDISNGAIIPICLPINNEMQQTLSDKYTVAGFGYTEHGSDSDVLLKILVPKVSRETCQSFHRSLILSDGHSCYGGEGIIDSCKGDSGSPLMNYVNVNGRLKAVQMGIVASGHSECGRGARNSPGIYTDVQFHLKWIFNNIEE